MNPPVDFLIITPLPEERDAILRNLDAHQLPPSDSDIRVYFGAELPVKFVDSAATSYKIIIAPLLGMGRVQAANVTGDAIRRWQPRYVLLVGIAGGYGKAGVQLGDVLIPDQIADYELQKKTEAEDLIRWEVHQVDQQLLGSAQSFSGDAWADLIRMKRPRAGKPHIHFGPMCTGDKVIANGLLDRYSDVWRKLIGVEMEAGGVARAAFQSSARPGFFMIRGVSDLADVEKDASKVKKWRAYACEVAAAFTVAWLRQGPVPPSSKPRGRTQISNKKGDSSMGFWNGRTVCSSRLHARVATGDPTVLVVLVHGAGGHPIRTWGNFPRHLVEEIGADADMISYDNPARPSSPTGVAEAAVELRRVILNSPRPYMHIFFLTHGEGALVVRELIAQDVESVAPKEIGVLSYLPPVAVKVRASFDFATPPHDAAGQPGLLGERLGNSLSLLRANDFPRPRFVEFCPEDGLALDRAPAFIPGHGDVVEVIEEMSNQKTLKPPSRPGDPLVGAIASRMRPYFNSPEMTVSYLTLRRFVGLDGGISLTFESERSVSDDKLTRNELGWNYGSQQSILKNLVEWSSPRQVRAHPRVLITGSAGVGKSTVLRRYARYSATQYLERQDSAQFCLYIPMQNMTLDPAQLKAMPPLGTAETGWRLISQYSSFIINEILLDPQEETAFAGETGAKSLETWQSVCALLTPAWVEGRTIAGPSKVILDGIDEFLVNCSSLTVETVSRLLRVVEGQSQNAKTQCLLAARSTLPAVAELSRNRDEIYEIRPLSEATAETLFPGTRDLLHGLQDQNLRRLLLSPLVLVRLGPQAADMRQGLMNSRTAILRLALGTLIEESQLLGLGKDATRSLRLDGWMQALALTAWVLYRDNRGFITIAELKERVTELKEQWIQGDGQVSHRFVEGTAIFESDCALQALRSRTVLNSLGKESVRFIHREWQDFLVSDYLSQCALGQVFSELDHRAFSKQIYMDAAEVLWQQMEQRDVRVTIDLLNSALPGDYAFKHPYTFMNICALLGNGPVDVDQMAFGKLINLICDQRCSEVTRIVAVSSFGMRVLRDDDRDQSIRYMRAEMVRALGEIVRQGVDSHRKVTASMAWCYRAELYRRHPHLRANGNEAWPMLNAMSESGVMAAGASGIVWKQENGSVTVDARCKSFQIAAAQYPLAVRGIPYEEISLTHYLFLAAATLKAEVAASEIFPLLRAVFAEESGVAERVESSTLPEVKKLFESCRQVAQSVLTM